MLRRSAESMENIKKKRNKKNKKKMEKFNNEIINQLHNIRSWEVFVLL